MNKILEIQFSGWTATPRLPFVLSGNALCMPVPSYSILLGMIGCCLGRNVSPNEVKIGYCYGYGGGATDLETRRRLRYDGRKIKPHDKGSDVYQREFHINPSLTLWIDRVDWLSFFESPIGTPVLGRSQDLLQIRSVKIKTVEQINKAEIGGCMLPFFFDKTIPGQLIQLAEAYEENESIGSGRKPIRSSVFVAIHPDNKVIVEMSNLYRTLEENSYEFYLHSFYD